MSCVWGECCGWLLRVWEVGAVEKEGGGGFKRRDGEDVDGGGGVGGFDVCVEEVHDLVEDEGVDV